MKNGWGSEVGEKFAHKKGFTRWGYGLVSKWIPTMLWSLIQMVIVVVFALLYMTFPCNDFAVADEATACTYFSNPSVDAPYNDPKAQLCAPPLPLLSLPPRTIPSRRPSRKFESALWLSIVTTTTVGWAAPAALARVRGRV